MYKVFISYRRRNNGIASAYIIYKALSQIGIQVYYDTMSLPPKVFPEELRKAVADSNCLLLLLQSDMFLNNDKKDWVLYEVQTALDNNIPIISLPLGDLGEFKWETENVPTVIKDNNITDINLLPPFYINNIDQFLLNFISKVIKMRSADDDAGCYYELMNKMMNKSSTTRASVFISDIIAVEPEERWHNAERVSIMAIGCGSLLGIYHQVISDLYAKNTKFRFLSSSYNSRYVKDIETMRQCSSIPELDIGYLKSQYEKNKQVISFIKNKSPEIPNGNIEYRLFDCSLTCTIQWIENKNDEFSLILVEFLPNVGESLNQKKMPALVISRKDPLYDFYSTQFTTIWDRSTIID